MFQNLAPIELSSAGNFTPIPLNGAGGVVSIKIPAFPSGQTGIYEIGIFNGDDNDPGFVAQRRVSLAPYSRFESFQVPPSLSSPRLGLRLIQKDDLGTYARLIEAQFHLPPAIEANESDDGSPEWAFFDQLPAGT